MDKVLRITIVLWTFCDTSTLTRAQEGLRSHSQIATWKSSSQTYLPSDCHLPPTNDLSWMHNAEQLMIYFHNHMWHSSWNVLILPTWSPQPMHHAQYSKHYVNPDCDQVGHIATYLEPPSLCKISSTSIETNIDNFFNPRSEVNVITNTHTHTRTHPPHHHPTLRIAQAQLCGCVSVDFQQPKPKNLQRKQTLSKRKWSMRHRLESSHGLDHLGRCDGMCLSVLSATHPAYRAI